MSDKICPNCYDVTSTFWTRDEEECACPSCGATISNKDYSSLRPPNLQMIKETEQRKEEQGRSQEKGHKEFRVPSK